MRLYPQDFLPVRPPLPTFGFAWAQGVVSPFVKSKQATMEAIFDAVGPFPSSAVVVDVGCGDGAFLVEAAGRFGCRCVGIDLDAALCAEARAQATQRGLGHLVEVYEKDLFQVLSSTTGSGQQAQEQEEPVALAVRQATVFFFYLLPDVLDKLAPWLLQRLDTTSGLTLIFNTWAPASPVLEARFLAPPRDRGVHAKRGFHVYKS